MLLLLVLSAKDSLAITIFLHESCVLTWLLQCFTTFWFIIQLNWSMSLVVGHEGFCCINLKQTSFIVALLQIIAVNWLALIVSSFGVYGQKQFHYWRFRWCSEALNHNWSWDLMACCTVPFITRECFQVFLESILCAGAHCSHHAIFVREDVLVFVTRIDLSFGNISHVVNQNCCLSTFFLNVSKHVFLSHLLRLWWLLCGNQIHIIA